MAAHKALITGMSFPHIALPTTDHGKIILGEEGWRALFVIRGAHCQICRTFLGQLEKNRAVWERDGIEVLVASADPVEKSRVFMQEAGYLGRAACALDVPAMRALGLWMTGPDVSKLDYVHAEPGFFLIDPEGKIAAVEASTLPSVRPDLALLDRSFSYIVENDVRPPFGRYGHHMSPPLNREGETVLLTGAAGYVGSAVAEKLRAAGYTVRGLTRSENKRSQLEAEGIEPVIGDVKDTDLLATAAAGVSAIVHTASPNTPGPGQSLDQIVADAVLAIEGLVRLAATSGVRLVVTSGASMYGPTNGKVVDETAPLQAPPFAVPLIKAETALAESGRACILRLGVVYGRRQSMPMRMLIGQVRDRGTTAVVDPANRLALVHVDDLADLYLTLLEAEMPPTVVNGVASVVPWPEVMGAIARVAGVSGEPGLIAAEDAAKLGGPAIYLPVDMAVSGELARQRLGWQPKGPDLATDLLASE